MCSSQVFCDQAAFCTSTSTFCPTPQAVPNCGVVVTPPGPDTGSQTVIGGNMTNPGAVSVEFYDGVAPSPDGGEGQTSVTAIPVPSNTSPPPGYRIIGLSGVDGGTSTGTVWEVHSTVQPLTPDGGTARIYLCFALDPSQLQGISMSAVQILHDDGHTVCPLLFGKTTPWCPVPAAPTPSPATNSVCGQVSSLSPFMLVVPTFPPPTINVPASLVVEATGPAGAQVTYAASANDVADGTLVPSCTPASGSTFPIGTTAVTCTATDSARLQGQASFPVTVRDTSGPIPGPVPSPIIAYATSTAGAKVSYAQPTATDAVDGPRPMTCTPASGATFAPWKTTVTCSASDTRGNTSTATFSVWVQFKAPGDGTFFLQPVNPDGSSIFKQGSTIPVKFKLLGVSAGITNLAAHVLIAKVSSSVTGTFVEAVSTANGDSGSTFRYDPSFDQYVFNLSTKSMTIGTWSLRADLGDGVDHSVTFSLK
jgi:hypothetical protein